MMIDHSFYRYCLCNENYEVSSPGTLLGVSAIYPSLWGMQEVNETIMKNLRFEVDILGYDTV
jgi:hypothetical protein